MIFQAVSAATGQNVIIKALNPEFGEDEKFSKRFLYEMRRAVPMSHPNIASVLDVGEASGYFYFVQEYFRDCLRGRITDRNIALASGKQIPLDSHVIMDILRLLCDGLDYAHQSSILHRDIRPENIFFREDGTPVLADFFIAEMVRASRVLSGRKTPSCPYHYASPEQILKKSLNPAADFYSLGVTLYEMLTGRPPYDAEEPIAIENMHVMEPVPVLPPEFSMFQDLLERMMEKDPAKRAQSSAELILLMEELEDAGENQYSEADDETPDSNDASETGTGEEPLSFMSGGMSGDEASTEEMIGELDLQLEGAGSYWNTDTPTKPPAPAFKNDLPQPPAKKTGQSDVFGELSGLDFSPPPSVPATMPFASPAEEDQNPITTGYSKSPAQAERLSVPPPPLRDIAPPAPRPGLSPSSGKPVAFGGNSGSNDGFDQGEDSLDMFSRGAPGNEEIDDDEPLRLPRLPGAGQSDQQGSLLDKIKNPRLLGVLGGLIVLAAVFVLFILPRLGGGDNNDGDQKETVADTLSTKERQAREDQYVDAVKRARVSIKEGRLEDAANAAEEAAKLKPSPEVEDLKKQITALTKNQSDDKAYESAVKNGGADALRSYLQQYPNGVYAGEARKSIERLADEEQKISEQRRKWAAMRVKLRSEPAMISTEEARLLILRRGFYERYYNKKGDFRNFFELMVVDQHKLVLDNATGLIWLQSGSEKVLAFPDAHKWVSALNRKKFAGYSDWRLPTLEEALSLMEPVESRYSLYIDPVFNKDLKYMWTADQVNKEQGWAVDFFAGDANRISLDFESYVRPVRTVE